MTRNGNATFKAIAYHERKLYERPNHEWGVGSNVLGRSGSVEVVSPLAPLGTARMWSTEGITPEQRACGVYVQRRR